MVTIKNGVNSLNADLAEGTTVSVARERVRQALNIDPNAVPRIDGEVVEGSHVLRSGTILEFVKASGEKGQII